MGGSGGAFTELTPLLSSTVTNDQSVNDQLNIWRFYGLNCGICRTKIEVCNLLKSLTCIPKLFLLHMGAVFMENLAISKWLSSCKYLIGVRCSFSKEEENVTSLTLFECRPKRKSNFCSGSAFYLFLYRSTFFLTHSQSGDQ